MIDSSKEILCSARVISEEKGLFHVQLDSEAIISATVSGRISFHAHGRSSFPAVGDWVHVEHLADSQRGVIRAISERKNVIQRRGVGGTDDLQILAANVDTILIATSVNQDLNVRRLERYLAVAHESRATPIILLTKADICSENIDAVVVRIRSEFPGVAVEAVSKDCFGEATFFAEHLRDGTTTVVLGSSGVGKSTLVNFLTGGEDIKTQDIREWDGKGRHTTTSRHLYPTRFGGAIIDTPGMRTLALADHEMGLQTQFIEVEELVSQCHFHDCSHDTEPGCAIRNALSEGILSRGRWINYCKLKAEVKTAQNRKDKRLMADERKSWKRRTKEARIRYQSRWKLFE
jgi:ribosome biogenesis GTPase